MNDDEMICVVPGDGSKPLGVLCTYLPEAESDGSRYIYVSEDMVLAWAYNICTARAAMADPRPCKGENANICVAEGCYGEACREVYGLPEETEEPEAKRPGFWAAFFHDTPAFNPRKRK